VPQAIVDALRTEIQGLTAAELKQVQFRAVMLTRLAGIEADIAQGDMAGARAELIELRKRVDGFETGTTAQPNDWVVSESAQAEIRQLIDALLAALPPA
jgi:hypothetical protein